MRRASYRSTLRESIAQLGERLHGMQDVAGSIIEYDHSVGQPVTGGYDYPVGIFAEHVRFQYSTFGK